MKKIMTVVMLLAVSTLCNACEEVEIVNASKLPKESKAFLKTHFDGVEVTSVVKEIDGLEKDYTVFLQNGFEVDFTRSGAWDEVDGRTQAVPASLLALLPAGIESYVNANFAEHLIVRVNREHYGYDIGLSGNIELEFTSSGQFFGYDD